MFCAAFKFRAIKISRDCYILIVKFLKKYSITIVNILEPKQLVDSLGLVGGHLAIWSIVFAESGLLVGFFLPGDSLLFASGFLASQGLLNIFALIIGCFICAVVGDNVGYATGKRFGHKLFSKEDSLFFHKDHIIKAALLHE